MRNYDPMTWFYQFKAPKYPSKVGSFVTGVCWLLALAACIFVFVEICKWLGPLWGVFGWAFIPVFYMFGKIILFIIDWVVSEIK